VVQPDDRTDRTDHTVHRAGPRTGVRRAAGPARRIKAPQRPRRLSGRAAALGLLLLALTLAYAYPLRVYLAQQAEIDQMEAAQQEQRQRIQELSDRVAAWNDDEYVIAQARSRLQLVRAGERIYVVGVEPAPAGEVAKTPNQPWYRQLWSSLETADNPPAAP
jgi:cell division protein FtsB